MKSTLALSKAFVALQNEALEKIKSFFKNKNFVRIHILPTQHLTINTGTGLGTVTEIHSDGSILFTQNKRKVITNPKFCEHLPMDAYLTILDELERMKKDGQLNIKI